MAIVVAIAGAVEILLIKDSITGTRRPPSCSKERVMAQMTAASLRPSDAEHKCRRGTYIGGRAVIHPRKQPENDADNTMAMTKPGGIMANV